MLKLKFVQFQRQQLYWQLQSDEDLEMYYKQASTQTLFAGYKDLLVPSSSVALVDPALHTLEDYDVVKGIANYHPELSELVEPSGRFSYDIEGRRPVKQFEAEAPQTFTVYFDAETHSRLNSVLGGAAYHYVCASCLPMFDCA